MLRARCPTRALRGLAPLRPSRDTNSKNQVAAAERLLPAQELATPPEACSLGARFLQRSQPHTQPVDYLRRMSSLVSLAPFYRTSLPRLACQCCGIGEIVLAK